MKTDKSAPEDRAGHGSDLAAVEPTADAALPRSEASRRAALISAIEGEMVPRLLMAYRIAGAEQDGCGAHGEGTDRWDVEELARLLVAHGPEIAWAFVEAVRRRGVPHERICLELLAPAGHRLAEQWAHRDFGRSELALGLNRLITVLQEVGKAANKERQESRHS